MKQTLSLFLSIVLVLCNVALLFSADKPASNQVEKTELTVEEKLAIREQQVQMLTTQAQIQQLQAQMEKQQSRLGAMVEKAQTAHHCTLRNDLNCVVVPALPSTDAKKPEAK